MAIEAGTSTYYQAKRGIVQDGLVLHLDAGVKESYSGGTVWYDLSNSKKNFNNYNGASLNKNYGGSTQYDGINDYTSNSSFFTADYWEENGAFTIFTFHKIDAMSATGALISNQKYTSEPSPIGGFGLMLYGQYKLYWPIISYDKDGTKTQYGWNTGRTFTLGQMTCIALVYDPSDFSMKLYRNGSLTNSTTNTSFKWTPRSGGGYGCNIGMGTQGGWQNRFQGHVYNMVVYNRALSADEISRNYNATRHRFGL
jgi:hypothetical protein